MATTGRRRRCSAEMRVWQMAAAGLEREGGRCPLEMPCGKKSKSQPNSKNAKAELVRVGFTGTGHTLGRL